MRPKIPLFLFLSLSSLLHPANPACVAHNSSTTHLNLSSPSPAPALAPSSSPESSQSPASSPRPFLANGPSLTPALSPFITPTPSPAEDPSLSLSLEEEEDPSLSPVSSPVEGPSLSPFSSPQATSPSSTAPVLSIDLPNAIQKMCDHTDHPDLCLSSISSLLPAFGTIDAKTLLTLEMKACQSHTKIARTQAAKLASDASSPSLASALQACTENYDDALDNLDAAAKAMDEGDKGTLNIMLSALIDDYSTCDDGFDEIPATSPMASYVDTLTKLASNCLALTELIKF